MDKDASNFVESDPILLHLIKFIFISSYCGQLKPQLYGFNLFGIFDKKVIECLIATFMVSLVLALHMVIFRQIQLLLANF